MPTKAFLGGRLALALISGLLAASLSLPALAIDTGGGGGEPAQPTMSAPATSSMQPARAPAVHLIDLNQARKFIARRDWNGSIKLLRQIVVQQPRNADALNLLGYSLRQKGRMAEAEAWYLKALKLDPAHLGANEYLGELYVLTGQLAKAQVRLKTIAKICGNTTCVEYQDLAKAIAAHA